MRKERTQSIVDAFADKHSPCCAGCDWWRWHNSVAVDCTRTVPVSGAERLAMLGMTRPEIMQATGLPNGSVKQAIWELQRAGLVAGTPKVRRDFSRYWRV